MKSDSLLKKAGPYGYILPALLVFAVFLFYPFFKTIYLSLYKTNKMGQAKLFVGLGNYMELFQSESFYNSLAVTLLFVAIVAAGSMALLTAWLNSGINFLYFSAGLSNIDETIYERASVDGANGIQKFFRLTLPGLSPIMFYTIVVNIIQAFQSFGQVKILTQGGPGESTNLIVYSIYRDAFFNYRFGSAAAQSVILFAIIMVMTLMMFKAEKKGVSY